VRASSTGRSVTGFLIGLAGSSVVVALALPRSSLAPLVTAILPIVVLVALSAIQGRSIWAGLGLRRAGLRFWPIALLIPTTVALLAYGIASALDLVSRGGGIGTAVLAGSVLGALLVLPAELGWRGFLLPRVQELTSARKGALLTSLAESAVHLPLVIWTTTYTPVADHWVVVPVAIVTITAAGVCYAWLRDVSGSLWPAALAHGVGKALLGGALVAGSFDARLALVAGEAGVATATGMSVVAVICLVGSTTWRRPRPASTGPEPKPPSYTVKKP
jgi:membrane protease YdiL (CAAX protease family)